MTKDTCLLQRLNKAENISDWLTWQMIKLIHELLLHVVEVVAGVMLWMGVFMRFRMGVLMMNGLCCFLGLRFGGFCSPSGPDPSAGQPHVSCQNVWEE